MSSWYSKLVSDPLNANLFMGFVKFFETEYENARKDLVIDGLRVRDVEKRIPGLVEYHYARLQELEAILKLYEREFNREKTLRKQFYFEKYNRQLGEKMADQYAEIDTDVAAISQLMEHVSLIRNKYLGIHKGLEQLGFRIGDITKLCVAGIEDAII